MKSPRTSREVVELRKVRVVLFLMMLVLVLQSGFSSADLPEFEKWLGGLGLVYTYYPEFEGELESAGFSLLAVGKPESGISLGIELNAELQLSSVAETGLDMGIRTASAALTYPFWLGDRGVLCVGIAGQYSVTNLTFDGTTIAEREMFAIMPNLTLGFILSESLSLKLTWLPKLGDKGLEVLSVGVYLFGNNK
jgi:hypothetical protein